LRRVSICRAYDQVNHLAPSRHMICTGLS
jgi:hypothetical protein